MADSFGDVAKGQTAMENCLQKNGNINVVYAINEPAAAGAAKALKAAGKDKEVMVVAVDGSCVNGVANIKNGAIAATSMQFPLKMAAMGVAAGVKFAKDGKRLTGYTDTGAELITDKPAKGVKGIDTAKASGLCF
jgi:fructose transport system substrate-binding protein